jgi:hypothetical protein
LVCLRWYRGHHSDADRLASEPGSSPTTILLPKIKEASDLYNHSREKTRTTCHRKVGYSKHILLANTEGWITLGNVIGES